MSPNDFIGFGQATHLGNYSETGSVTFSSTSNPVVQAVSGFITYEAANGDELDATVLGELDVSTGAVTATITFVGGGTGRFAHASGTAELHGQMLGGGALSIRAVGGIEY